MATCALAAALLLSCATLFARPPRPDVSLEYAVKATYLYKLAPFVNWPPGTFKSPAAPFDICLLGHDPFGGFLEKAVAGRKLGTHPFRVRKLSAVAGAPGCRIVFIGAMRASKVREALRAFSGKPVLTVTDSGDPGSSGSIVQFVLDHGHVRFEIDNTAAVHNHLVISSKLLGLALTVKGAG